MSQVRVYNTDVLSGILEAGAAATEKAPSAASQRRPPQRSTPDSMDSSVAREKQRRDMREKAFRTRMERLHKDVERRIKQTTEQRELKFQQMLRSYEQERDGFEHECYKTVDYKEETDRRRARQMYQEWCTNVFDKIQHRVASRVDAKSTEAVEAEKHALYKEFLAATNRKDGLFRDIIIESDYDPLHWREASLKYSGKVEDPVKRELMKQSNDREGIGGKGLGIPPARSKPTLDVKMWDKLEATPHGKAAEMFAQSMSGIKKPTSKTQITTAKIDHYDIDMNPRTATHELHGFYATKGKKTFASNHGHFAID